ncbi:MAG: FAD-dependent oxidoreductase, partial [Planctomycetota bacterium]
MTRDFDVIVIGGGHAGVEAAWAAANMGADVALVTLDPAKIGQMSCNPAIGGLAKGQIVREVDALGGLMGQAADATGIQFRLLNRSKGPAVRGPRCQSDKYRYAEWVRNAVEGHTRIEVIQGEVASIRSAAGAAACNVEDGKHHAAALAADLANGPTLRARSLVLTTGTFMRGLMHTGDTRTPGGRVGEAPANAISAVLQQLGFELGRLKTGTPPRLHADSIDFAQFELQPGDERPVSFSYMNEYAGDWSPPITQLPCHIGYTTEAAHDVIRANLHRAPMFSGQIDSAGPRYCPSIEDKVHRFADKPRHQIFLEPESLDTDEIYCNGISTSLPADVQRAMLDHVPGLEKAEVIRWGYAVEYDMVWPRQVRATLEAKRV